MTELTDESRALLEAEGPLDEPTAAEIDAMHVRVVAALGPLGLPSATAPAPDPTPVATKAAATTSLKVLGGAVAAAVGGSALFLALNQPVSEAPVPPPRAVPVVSAAAPAPVAPLPPPVASPEPEPAPVPAVPAPATATPRSAKPTPPPAASVVAPSASEEALLVATAEAQLRAGHPAAALALYERHLREYPQGALRQESHTGRVIALCGVGRSAEVRAEVERFATKYPGSPTALRMQRACGIEP